MEQKPCISVCVVDDHAIVRRGIASMVNSFRNYQVVLEAADGEQLIGRLKKSAVIPDICLMDIAMPEMDGYDTVAYLRKHWPSIHTIALSVYHEDYNIIKMLRCGARGYISKEADLQQLHTALSHLYQYGHYYPEDISRRVIPALTDPEQYEIAMLSKREEEILGYFCTNMSYAEIAKQLHMSIRTVETYRDTLFRKLQKKTRIGLVTYAIRIGLCR